MENDRQLILFARVVIVLHRVLERKARGTSLSIPQYRFLLGLKRGATRASELATLSGIGRPSASALVDDLERKGLLEKVVDPTDGRATIVKLTNGGLKVYSDFEATLSRELSQYVSNDLSGEWPPSLLDAIEQLAYLVDKGPSKPAKT